jgi:hypothetical protein
MEWRATDRPTATEFVSALSECGGYKPDTYATTSPSISTAPSRPR